MLIMPGGKSWTLPNSGPEATDPTWRGWKPGDPAPQQNPQTSTQKNDPPWGQGAPPYSPSQSAKSKSPDMSAWGKAQPIQPPSQGTPYGGDMAAWSSPQKAREALGREPVNFGRGMWGAPGGEPPHVSQPTGWGSPRPMSEDFGAFSQPTFTYGAEQNAIGNLGNSQYGRPPGFQASFFDMQGNPVSAEQQQAQRAAMVLQLQQAQLPYVLGNAMNQDVGRPQFDFRTMLQNANNAVRDGFYNPFQRFYQEQDAIPRLGQQSFQTLYDPRPMDYPPPAPSPRESWQAPRDASYREGAFYDDQGNEFRGTQSYAPDTPEQYRQDAYRRFAEGQGYYRRDARGGRLYDPGAAQPVDPPSYGRPYGPPISPGLVPAPEDRLPPIGPGLVPAPEDRRRPDGKSVDWSKVPPGRSKTMLPPNASPEYIRADYQRALRERDAQAEILAAQQRQRYYGGGQHWIDQYKNMPRVPADKWGRRIRK